MQITQSQNNTPQLSLIINAPIDAVWDALRDKEKLLQWHGWDTPGLEEEIENIYFTDIKEDTANSQKRTLIVNGGDTFIVEAKESAVTQLTLVRTGLSGDATWDAYYGNITEGWVSFIEQLRFMLEYKPGTSRKATFTNMTHKKDKLLTQLNLAEEKVGARFSGQLEGSDIAGTVWFSTPSQLGLVVENWGPGLLILQFSEKAYTTTLYSSERGMPS